MIVGGFVFLSAGHFGLDFFDLLLNVGHIGNLVESAFICLIRRLYESYYLPDCLPIERRRPWHGCMFEFVVVIQCGVGGRREWV